MKTRKRNWYDADNNRPLFGIMVWIKGQWMNAVKNGQLVIFDNEAERDKARVMLSKQPAPDLSTLDRKLNK